MVCIIIGFKITDKAELHERLLKLSLYLREELITGITDFEDEFVGYCILDMGFFGVDRVNGPINILDTYCKLRVLGIDLGRFDFQVAEITTLELGEEGL